MTSARSLGSRCEPSVASTMAAERVCSIASEESTSDGADKDDHRSRTKRELVDAEELEMALPIGSDEDPHERAQHKATRQQSARSPAIGGFSRIIVHERRVAAIYCGSA